MTAQEIAIRIDELKLLAKATAERTEQETWEDWAWRVTDYLKKRQAQLPSEVSGHSEAQETAILEARMNENERWIQEYEVLVTDPSIASITKTLITGLIGNHKRRQAQLHKEQS